MRGKFYVICLVIPKKLEKGIKFYTLANVKVFVIPKFLTQNPKFNSKRDDGLSLYFPLWQIGSEPTFGTVQRVLYAIPF
jgi:hypothetical protein